MTGPEPTILHVDMDAFFASVELLRHPELRGRPVVVGGVGSRGVVAAASYEARAFGIHSAMPSVRAQRLCPHAVFLPGDHDHYADVSGRVMAIFRSMTPLVEPLSLDEAFLDVAGVRRLHGTAPEIAAVIRARVLAEEGLTCAVGVAPTKFLAKLASEAAKPKASLQGPRPGAGVVVVEPGRELAFLHPLPVRALWGVGPATLAKLERLGVRTVGDLAELPEAAVVATLGSAQGRHLHRLANGIDERAVEPDQAVKSVGHEETFAHDLVDRERLGRELVRMADAVAARLRRHDLAGRTVTIKVRYHDFHTITRSVTSTEAISASTEVARAAKALLDGVEVAAGVRLLGVSVGQLGAIGPRQLTLADAAERPSERWDDEPAAVRWEEADAAVDAIRERFGAGAVVPAALASRDGIRVKRAGDQQWGPNDPAADPPDGASTGR